MDSYKAFFNADAKAPKVAHMTAEFQQQQQNLVDKRFQEVAQAVIENKYQSPQFATHSSVSQQTQVHRQRAIKAKELPDAGFTYEKNKNVEKVTQPDPALKLPQGVRYNIVIGSLQEFPPRAQQK